MTDKARRGRPRNPAVDRAILDMALTLFIEGGLDNVSYDQISRRSGVSRAAIYRRWASRPQLLVAAIEARTADDDASPPDWAERDFRARLDWFILQTPKLMLSPFYRRLAGEIIAQPQARADLTFLFNETIARPQRLIFARLMQAAITEDIIDEAAPADLIYDMLYGALLNRLVSHTDGGGEDEVRRYLVGLLATLGLKTGN
ncbi:MAG: hypothetical protein CFE28_09325 [Alphaproteobacteria bacterium PA2]|nr:MAG: hypothetical protein CFE28_09325 [Alphaproteobacteria bacterium PA2]